MNAGLESMTEAGFHKQKNPEQYRVFCEFYLSALPGRSFDKLRILAGQVRVRLYHFSSLRS
ncbi:MAG: hypothetical protein K9G67_08075 [Bacteroidales bacterium]|nr:hypothetical protein [Bacteroidales bacterium]MCF8345276.1 hypothetical protein [Bacteroidales bacterium]MCF8376296.1 hypothetical protein [Bacteroidales bacterium]